MPKAFVHGVPETSAIWGALVDELETRGIGDITLLTPPGFGAPVPQGWEPNQSNYCNWLLAELEALGGNVDLVGHDWGAGHVYGALAARPGLLRSWATDSAGLIHADYKWHDLAQAFQTPDVGEQAVEAMTGGTPADRAAMLMLHGRFRPALHPRADTAAIVSAGRATPGSHIDSQKNFVGSEQMYAEVAMSLGAKALTMKGFNHWWMFGEGIAIAAVSLRRPTGHGQSG